jgi:hypothetical protein
MNWTRLQSQAIIEFRMYPETSQWFPLRFGQRPLHYLGKHTISRTEDQTSQGSGSRRTPVLQSEGFRLEYRLGDLASWDFSWFPSLQSNA